MKITLDVAPVTPEVKQAIEDAWVAILRAELEARAERERKETAAAVAPDPPPVSR